MLILYTSANINRVKHYQHQQLTRLSFHNVETLIRKAIHTYSLYHRSSLWKTSDNKTELNVCKLYMKRVLGKKLGIKTRHVCIVRRDSFSKSCLLPLSLSDLPGKHRVSTNLNLIPSFLNISTISSRFQQIFQHDYKRFSVCNKT